MNDGSNRDDIPGNGRRRAGQTPRPPHRPYKVGKGMPPKDTQFKKGCKPGPGRPKGSTTKHPFDKLLDEKAWVVEGGRRVRKRIRDILDKKLVQVALGEDLRGYALYLKYKLELERMNRSYGPAPEELAAKIRDDELRQENARKTFGMLVQLRRRMIPQELIDLGVVIESESGEFTLAAWVREEALIRKRANGDDPEPCPNAA